MRALVVLVSMVLLAACVGTSSGNPGVPGEPDGSDTLPDDGPDIGSETAGGYPNCERDPSPLDSLDEQTTLGFSAADVLAFAEAVHESKIRWNADGLSEVGPETGEQDVTITIARGDGEARYVALRDREPTGPEPTTDIGLPQADCASLAFIEIEVDVQIVTGQGALDEHARGVLTARRADFATLHVEIAAEDLQGTLELGITRGEFVFDELSIDLSIAPLGLRGGVGATFSSAPPTGGDDDPNRPVGGATSGGGGIATIGLDASCDPSGLPIEDDQELAGIRASDAIDLMNAVAGLGVSFSDGTSSTLELGFAHDGETVCAVIEPFALDAPTDPGKLSIGGTLSVTSADGRVDGDWPVRLEAFPDGSSGVERVVVSLLAPNFSEPGAADIEATYGIHGLQTGGHDGVYLMLELTVAPDGNAASATGSFRVQALDMAECPVDTDPNDNSTPGCRGSDITDLLTATLTGE